MIVNFWNDRKELVAVYSLWAAYGLVVIGIAVSAARP